MTSEEQERPTLTQESNVHRGQVDRRAIASMLMQLFDHWQLTTDEQLDVLGFATSRRAVLTRYRRGEPISASPDTLDRACHLLRIHQNLRLLFPHNRELAYAWMKTCNKGLSNRTPIEVIREHGLPGLLMVVTYLDRAAAL